MNVSITIESIYVLPTSAYGKCWSWRNNGGGFTGRQEHTSLSSATNGGYSQNVLVHTLDPITAISLGLVTVDELRGAYPPGFIALLDMLKPT